MFRPLRDAPPVNAIIAAIGLLFFLEAVARAIWGSDFRVLPTPYDKVVRIFGLTATHNNSS